MQSVIIRRLEIVSSIPTEGILSIQNKTLYPSTSPKENPQNGSFAIIPLKNKDFPTFLIN